MMSWRRPLAVCGRLASAASQQPARQSGAFLSANIFCPQRAQSNPVVGQRAMHVRARANTGKPPRRWAPILAVSVTALGAMLLVVHQRPVRLDELHDKAPTAPKHLPLEKTVRLTRLRIMEGPGKLTETYLGISQPQSNSTGWTIRLAAPVLRDIGRRVDGNPPSSQGGSNSHSCPQCAACDHAGLLCAAPRATGDDDQNGTANKSIQIRAVDIQRHSARPLHQSASWRRCGARVHQQGQHRQPAQH